MSKLNQIEEHMLIQVNDDCTTLELDDGSKLSVEPGDTPTIATWLPTETIRIELANPNATWPYELINTEEDVSVRAMRIE